MILSDAEIEREISEGNLGINPYDRDRLQPASYDVLLGDTFRVFEKSHRTFIDPRNIPEDLTKLVKIDKGGYFVLHPNELVLGATVEYWRFSDRIVGRLEGKSSLGRIGLLIHATAGFFDPGFQGTGTLELANVAGLPILLYPGMAIGQMSFAYLSSPSRRLYGDASLGSHYQGQVDPEASRYGK